MLCFHVYVCVYLCVGQEGQIGKHAGNNDEHSQASYLEGPSQTHPSVTDSQKATSHYYFIALFLASQNPSR